MSTRGGHNKQQRKPRAPSSNVPSDTETVCLSAKRRLRSESTSTAISIMTTPWHVPDPPQWADKRSGRGEQHRRRSPSRDRRDRRRNRTWGRRRARSATPASSPTTSAASSQTPSQATRCPSEPGPDPAPVEKPVAGPWFDMPRLGFLDTGHERTTGRTPRTSELPGAEEAARIGPDEQRRRSIRRGSGRRERRNGGRRGRGHGHGNRGARSSDPQRNFSSLTCKP
ncbi:hypothetical protein B0O99DRAFT_587947 [Bisporella sp. PMI_857]|nr:hypothetical protein B0O99DRAFT_587947 [Bisporella sp. PMI_857]